jgi:hypothetical protein
MELWRTCWDLDNYDARKESRPAWSCGELSHGGFKFEVTV